MKAIDLAKKLNYINKNTTIVDICPDELNITDTALCITTNRNDDKVCEDCWNREVDDKRVEWLMECKRMCDLMCP